MSELNNLKQLAGDEMPQFFSTGNWEKDIKEINEYVRQHPEKFTKEDITGSNGDVICRSRLVLKDFLMGGGKGYHYISYNKDGLETGAKPLDVYMP